MPWEGMAVSISLFIHDNLETPAHKQWLISSQLTPAAKQHKPRNVVTRKTQKAG